jgi:23S rRNA-intervening sequence protein
MTNRNFMDVEDLEVYKKLCGLPIDVCDLTHKWPQEEKYELGSQSRRSSNSVLPNSPKKMNRSLRAGPLLLNMFPDT